MYDLHAIYVRLRSESSPLSRAARDFVRCLCRKLDPLLNGGDSLFFLWRRELEFTYGDLERLFARHAVAKSPAAEDAFQGWEYGAGAAPYPLLMGVQTFYSVLVKCIAFRMLQEALPTAPPHSDIRSVLSGQAFADAGIRNFGCDDWFSWLLKYWDPEIQEACSRLSAALEETDTFPSVEVFLRHFRPDSLKHIYETVFPRELRHILGEYYTPDWLAACVIQNALEASGKSPASLRFIDPTCGSGTFLTRIMKMARADSVDGLPRLSAAVGFDINPLSVLTAKANYLAAILDQLPAGQSFLLPIYLCDVINMPFMENGNLVVDTNFGLTCSLPLSLCRQAVCGCFQAEDFLEQVDRDGGCEDLRKALSGYDMVSRRIIANVLLDRIFAFHEKQADIVVGNPPWVNWEYLPPAYREKSRPLWTQYGLFSARGRSLSFSKEDISTLITCAVIDRLLVENGILSFILRQVIFKSAQNGAGFRRFHLDQPDTDFRVLRVDDLGRIKPFRDVGARSALVLIRKGEKHTFPVAYNCWSRRKHFLKATRDPDVTADSIMAFVHVEPMAAFPARQDDAASIWINTPQAAAPVMDRLLGSNPYKARTGVYTGGANAVYWLDILGRDGGSVQVRNIVGRARRKVPALTAPVEPDHLYPLIQGSDITMWGANPRVYILCPHTPETRIFPVEEAVLKAETPGTYAYLHSFREHLDARRGFAGWEKGMQSRCFYSILRIGSYTFSRYKVAWRYIARTFVTAVISTVRDPYLGEKLCIPNEKVMYVSTDCQEEAYYLCGVLSSSPVRYCVTCYMNPTSISAHVLDKLRIPRYDPDQPLHRTIAETCLQGHQTDDPVRRAALQRKLDQAVGILYGISGESLELIRAAQ